jgi:hypothetical protein
VNPGSRSLPNHKSHTDRLPDLRPLCRGLGPKECRVYVAVNVGLNLLARTEPPESSLAALRPYVFKVGVSHGCFDRTRSLNNSRDFKPMDPRDGGRAIYAGVKGWRIGRCWPLPDVQDVRPGDYDWKVFNAWITGRPGVSPPVTGVRNVEFHFMSSAKRGGGHTATELYVMDERFLSDGVTGVPGHALHDAILLHARMVLGSVVSPALGGSTFFVVPAPRGCNVAGIDSATL